MKLEDVKKEINNHITPGIGVLLGWKHNKLYKFIDHHRHLDPEDSQVVLIAEDFTTVWFIKLCHPHVIRDSNRGSGGKICYISDRLK